MTEQPTVPDSKLIQYINLKLAALGCPTCESDENSQSDEMSALLAHQREIDRLAGILSLPGGQSDSDISLRFSAGRPARKIADPNVRTGSLRHGARSLFATDAG